MIRAQTTTARKAFKYRLYPTRLQVAAMEEMLETHRRLYNDALAEQKRAWGERGERLNFYDHQRRTGTARKTNPFLAKTNQNSCNVTLLRLDKAFAAFFRRVKTGERPGYPRFKGRDRFDSVEFGRYGNGCKLDGDRVYLQHVGQVKVKLHRPTEGRIKTVTFKRQADGWHVIFCCDLGERLAGVSPNPPVGIDLGLKAFLVTSDGETVAPPKVYRKAEAALRRAQRRVSRRKKGSHRRRKAVQLVARLHLHVADQRRDFHHKVALGLVERYGIVYHEDLNVKGLSASKLAKSVHDVGWGQFLAILRYKAADAGSAAVGIPPRFTSQLCSRCGTLVPKTLRDRIHVCHVCGYTADRDLNAAENILRLGASRQASTKGDLAHA